MLTEHYAGAFPPWLAPVQVVGIPIADGHVDYLEEVAASCARRGSGWRSTRSDDRMQKKIRNAQQAKVPFMLIAGDEDVAAGAVSFRYRDGSQHNGVPVDGRGRARSSGSPVARRVPGRRLPVTASRDSAGAVAGAPDGFGGCGPRTGWPTSRARTSRRTPRPATTARSAGSQAGPTRTA